ncbi:sodium- and chloride-dependent GABA transporter 1-like isoform X2 [Cylas formicarius]|nr:sodium- and chloride-dependent GABA transporter 1-like isoform X2 [Cylas formicarius]
MSNKLYFWDDGKDDIERNKAEGPKLIQQNAGNDDSKRVSYRPPVAEEDDRGGWGNKLDFLMSCISLSVGLGNVWRFPYLCYKNGGGAFLITYSISMIFCGIPLFFQEVAIGQYLGSGGMTFVGQLCPILKGVGFATMTIVFLLDVYYCIIIAWTLFYIISTFSALPKLPWAGCENWWNTEQCYSSLHNISEKVNKSSSPVEEFFERKVLGMTNPNPLDIQWGLFVCLLIGWLLVYFVVRKGLHQSGKVIWFSALFPYVILLIMLVRAVTLEGAGDGLLYYVTPRWEVLSTPGPWMDGASQIFFAYSIGCGALPALGSYNKFHHNSYKDAIITCIINTLTSVLAGIVTFSILGHLAHEQHSDVGDVVKSGPGLVFLTYPEVVLKLPGSPFWAATFFIMLVLLGIDSEFCLVESFITGLIDNWSTQLRPRRQMFTALICLVMFLLGIPMVTHGGMYIFQLMDYYSASGMSLLWVCFFQTVAISWVFGVDKLSDCVEQMMGLRPNCFWRICWKYFAPAVILVIFVGQCLEYQTLRYGEYKYPFWANVLGFGISLSSMLWVPLYAVFYAFCQPSSILKNLRNGLVPTIKQRKISVCDKSTGQLITQSSVGLITPSPSFFETTKPEDS